MKRSKLLPALVALLCCVLCLSACAPEIPTLPELPTQAPTLAPTASADIGAEATEPGIALPNITPAPLPTPRSDMESLDVTLAFPLRCSVDSLTAAIASAAGEESPVRALANPETLEDGHSRYEIADHVYLSLWLDPYEQQPLRILIAEYGEGVSQDFHDAALAVINHVLRDHEPETMLDLALLDGIATTGGIELSHTTSAEGHVLQLRPMLYDGDALPVTAEGFLANFTANADVTVFSVSELPSAWEISGEVLTLALPGDVTITAGQDSTGRLTSVHLVYNPSEEADILAKQEEARRLSIESVCPPMKLSLRTGTRMNISACESVQTFAIGQDWISGISFLSGEEEHLWLSLPSEDSVPPVNPPALINPGIQNYNNQAAKDEIPSLPDLLPTPVGDALLISNQNDVMMTFHINVDTKALYQVDCHYENGFAAASEQELIGTLRAMLCSILPAMPDDSALATFSNNASHALINIIGGLSRSETFSGDGYAATIALDENNTVTCTIAAQAATEGA